MAAFARLDWTRFDVRAILDLEGVATVDRTHRDACRAWLREQGYSVATIDFSWGVDPALVALGEHLRWEAQFGYRLTSATRNLDALNDGFDFALQPGEGHVLELLDADVAYREDPRWLEGLLWIARHHSRCQLALGARFFTTLVLDPDSPLVEISYGTLSVSHLFGWSAPRSAP